MNYLKPLDQLTPLDESIAGSKAVNLGELIRAGFSAPRGFVVTAAAYRDAFAAAQTSAHARSESMNDKIAARLATIQMDDPMELENTAKEIRAWVENIPALSALETEIQTALGELDASAFAVRSSLVAQDIPNPNATRVPRAHLGVRAENISDAVRHIWSILWDTRRVYFRHRKKINAAQLAIAAIIQPMIDADAAGLLFTISPRGAAANEIHIDAAWGLGDAVVSARRRADHFVVDKITREIREQSIAQKTVKEVVAASGGIESIGVAAELQDAPSLTDAQMRALADIGARVETHFKSPQDIEWCLKDGEFFLVQTRAMNR